MNTPHDATRRRFLQASLGMLGAGVAVPQVFARAAGAATADALAGATAERERILVVIELAGGNDGLNTVVPVEDDRYYRARPRLGIAKDETLRLEDGFGLHPRMVGVHNLWRDGRVAIVHGCGYPDPDRSHFTSMRYWHTGAPHRGEARGWVGRLADARWPGGPTGALVNFGERESLAVRSAKQAPIIFADPTNYVRHGDPGAAATYAGLTAAGASKREAVDFVRHIARTATDTQRLVREATEGYETPVSYGVPFPTVSRDLRNTAALIAADFPARVYYVSFSGFDTHSAQESPHQLLLQYFADAVEGFQKDLDRLGRADDVLMLGFSEFGRRVEENQSGGTDHGTASPMWLIGKPVAGGLHGTPPDLGDLDTGDLRYTTDFRRVYGTALEWMGAPIDPAFPALRALGSHPA